MTAETVVTPDPMPAGPDRMADIPAGLSIPERSAYLAGYSRAMKAYAKKHGIPSLQDPAPAPGTAARKMFGRRLSELHNAYVTESHPVAHKSGMSALTRYRKLRGLDIPAPVKPARAPRKPRKTAAPVESAPADVLAAGVESGRVVIIPVTSTPAPVEPVDVPAEPVTPVESPAPVRTYRTRRDARRELAAEMRAAGIKPEGQAWEAAKAKAGLS